MIAPYDPTDTASGVLAAIAHLGATVQQLRADMATMHEVAAHHTAAARDARNERAALEGECMRLLLYIAELELHLRAQHGGENDIEAASAVAQRRWKMMQTEECTHDNLE